MINGKETLIHGELAKESFDDFIERLRYQVRGAGVNEHVTDSATFVVQRKRLITGIDKDYTDNTLLILDDSYNFDFDDFASGFDDEELDQLIIEGAPITLADGVYSCESDRDLFDWVEDNKSYDWNATHAGYDYIWEYVNHHMTKEAAEAFIQRKKHDYGEMRVFIGSAYWSWELMAIMNGLLDGKIVFQS